MRLYAKMKKTLATTLVVAMATTAVPVVTFASDYTGHWAEKAITKWSEEGILVGYEDGTFKPESTITRAELAQIITAIFGLEDITGGKEYEDVAANAWYNHGVSVVAAAGIMNDYEDGTFRPDAEATREEAAYAIARAYRLAATDETVEFTDKAEISDWAVEEIAALVAGEVLSGYPDGSFQPKGSLKRAEVVTMIDRITAELVNAPDKEAAATYSQDVEGNLVINTPDMILKDMTITGNLYIAEGVADGDITLDGVTVLGTVVVEGGGANTVKVKGNTVLNDIVVDKSSGETPRILISSQVVISGELVLTTSTVVEGENAKLPKIVVTGAGEVKIKGKVEVATIDILAPVKLDLAKDIKVETVAIAKEAPGVTITGKGEITGEVTVDADGVKLEVKVDKDKVTTGDGVTDKPAVTPPTTGGGGGGGGGGNPPVGNTELKVTGVELTLKDSKTPLPIPFDGTLDIVVDVTGDGSIMVEGVQLKDKTVTGIKVNANVNKVSVSLAGLNTYAIELDTNKVYTIAELKAEVEKYEASLIAFIKDYGVKAGIDHEKKDAEGKTELDRVIAAVGAYFDRLGNVPAEITGTYVLDKAKTGEMMLETYAHHYTKIENLVKLLSVAEISLSGLTEDITAINASVGKITVAPVNQSGYDSNLSYKINVSYKGVEKKN